MHEPAIILTALGMLAALLAFAVRLGMQAGRIEESQRTVLAKMNALDQIPGLVVRVGNVEHFTSRNTSDIKELAEKVGEHRGRLDSIPDPGE